MLKIKNLKASWFRGIVETNLELNGKSLILFGENGDGKSSFVDALEFLFKSQVSHLEEAQTTSTARHVPHILCVKKEDCAVEIEFQDGSVINRNFKKGLSQIPSHVQSYFQHGAESPFILRRKYLLDFILTQPAPRYQRLASLIRISDLEEVELSLMRKKDQLQDEVISIKHALENIQKQSEQLLGKPVESEKQLLAILNEKLENYKQTRLNSFDEIQQRKTEVVAHTKKPEEIQMATEINKAIGITDQLNEKISTFEKHKGFWQKIETLQKDKGKLKELMFKQLLEHGQHLIQQSDLNKCPLCFQPINRDEVLSAIEERLRSLTHITKQVDEIKTLRLSLQSDLEEMIVNTEVLVKTLKNTGYKDDLKVMNDFREDQKKLNDNINQDFITMKIGSFKETYNKIFSAEIKKFLQEIGLKWLQSKHKKLTPTEKDKKAVQVIDLLTGSAEIRKKYVDLTAKLKLRERVAEQIEVIYKCFLETKHAEVQQIYDTLQNDFTNYYQILHPDEEQKDIQLVVKPERRGSAEIRSKFYDRENEDPRGFNSEAHLDSLGLCIFLAFVKHFNMAFPLIILDDVISSIDATHRNRISDLIYKEFTDHQFLITTHDHIWFEELHAAQRAFSVENKFSNLKIIRWSLEEGPIIDKYKPRWEEIEEKINDGDKEGAARVGRRSLEWFCYEMCVGLQASVLLKRDNKYELGDLYNPFVTRVKKLLPKFHEDNKSIFQKLEKNIIFGNILSHNNPKAGNVSIKEVKDFVDSLFQVYSFFSCEVCSNLVQYYQKAQLIKCSCGKGKKKWDTK